MKRARGLIGLIALLAACNGGVQSPTHEPKPMSERKAARPAILDASASAVTFERIAAFPPPGWQIPRHVELSPDGKMVTYLQAEGGGETMALFALENGKHRVLVRAAHWDLVRAPGHWEYREVQVCGPRASLTFRF